MKNFLIVANWKLNSNKILISHFLTSLKLYFETNKEKNNIAIAPSFVYLDHISKNINHDSLFLAAQNVDLHLQGAFTGEVSILMLKDIGVKYVIIGHSERRMFHLETNDIIAEKFNLVKENNLIPILCIGETKIEKKLHNTEKIIAQQLDCIFRIYGKKAFRNSVIAYEPIWAIGTGISANAKEVQKVNQFIKKYISKYDSISLDSLIVQYGGSLNSINAKEFVEKSDIDGLLIGNASLDCQEFLKIVRIVNQKY